MYEKARRENRRAHTKKKTHRHFQYNRISCVWACVQFSPAPCACAMVQYLISPTQYAYCSAAFSKWPTDFVIRLGLDTIKWDVDGDGGEWRACIVRYGDSFLPLQKDFCLLFKMRGERLEENHHLSDNTYILCMDFRLHIQRNLAFLQKRTFSCIQFSSGYVRSRFPFHYTYSSHPFRLMSVRVWVPEFTSFFVLSTSQCT